MAELLNRWVMNSSLCRPIYLSIWLGPSQYPIWKLKKDPSVTDNVDKVALLAYIVFARRRTEPQHDERSDLAILDFLHGKNLLGGQTHLAMRGPRPMTVKERDDSSITTPNLTVWQHFLQFEWKDQHDRRHYLGGTNKLALLAADGLDARFAKTVLWFLRRGADPAFAAKASTIGPPDEIEKFQPSVDFYFKSRTPDGNETDVIVNDTVENRVRKKSRRNIVDTPSLREWILGLKVNDETKQEILEFLPATVWYETVGRQWRANRKWLYDIPHDRGRVQLLVLAILPLVVLLILYYWVGFTSLA